MKNLLLNILFILCFACHTQAQIITTFAGGDGDSVIGDGGPAFDAAMGNPIGLAIDNAGNVYISGHYENRIRKVNTSGIISTIAGTGIGGYSGNGGPATDAEINEPNGVAVDNAGDVFFADGYNNCIRKIDTFGIISTVAGISGHYGYNGDNVAATAAMLYGPGGIAIDAAGDLFLTDGGNNRIRKVNTAGIITTIAGNGTGASTGDNGPATAAEINNPYSILLDGSGNLYMGGQSGGWLRKIDASGIITTLAGTGASGYSGDGGPATAAQVTQVEGLALDAAGNLYFSDYLVYRVRKINAAGIISTYAGDGIGDYNGDNIPALTAQLLPIGLALDGADNLYIADFGNSRVRRIASTVSVPVIKNTQSNLTLYPNPSDGSFIFTLSSNTDEQVNVTISNITGEQIKQFTMATNNPLNIQLNAPPGIYFLTAITANGRWNDKIVINDMEN